MLVDPLETTTIHDAAVGMPEEVEYPECVAGPPVVFVAVKDNVRVGCGTESGHKFFEASSVKVVADERVVEIECPIDFECAGNMSGRIEEGVFVRFDDDDIGVIEICSNPICCHEGLGMGVPFGIVVGGHI